ncbi:hypothetical protein ISN45_At03g001550 [Arabidopsis thaliana x Arabidopsis arenosa]|uniref:RGF7 n=2 Tax=Arabidopsis TaxID=3701 RepID=A0A178VHM0_ARATH|nr:hypothetical protein ISN45_At03g001550 [Arabidopsis thaliana x Arabidopsis arenosa]OAP04513.1 RGF7 [Arabidopsis thaliana]
MEMKKWSYANLITLALLFLFFIILLLAFQGGSRDDDHQHVHVAIRTKDISMGRKLKSLKPINQQRKTGLSIRIKDLMMYKKEKYMLS